MEASQTQQLARQAIDQLIAALDAGQSDRLKAYLAMLARFRAYSWGNVLLISMQSPAASRVAGYRAWQHLGRQVCRGAKAIRILAPIVRRDAKDEDDDGKVVAFKTAHVFDISQTEGSPLPEFAQVAGEPGVYLARLKEFARRNGIVLEYSERLGNAEGLSAGGRIVLKTGLAPAAEFAVLAHEAAHELIPTHRVAARESRTVRETEAEAVSFVVCQAIGLDTNTASADYLGLYDGNKETLLASLAQIQRTAAAILDGILPPADQIAGERGEPAIVPLPLNVKRLAA